MESLAADASVREAVVNDAPAVGTVQSIVWREAYAGVLPPTVLAAFEPQAFARVWRQSLSKPPEGVHRLVVAREGHQVIGYAALGPSQDPDTGQATAEVTTLGVLPAARRRGHGSRLLNAVVSIAADLGAESVTGWLPASDEVGRAFLVSAGFDPDGAYRDRVVGPDGETVREVRVVAWLGGDEDSA